MENIKKEFIFFPEKILLNELTVLTAEC